jgi:hypothetical protein
MEIFFHIQKAVVARLAWMSDSPFSRPKRHSSMCFQPIHFLSRFEFWETIKWQLNLGILKSSGPFSDRISLNGFDI